MTTRERVGFNDGLMLFVAVPLILSWLAFSCYIIYSGINDDTGFVQSNLDFFVSLIAIIGGPALLFINAIMEAWKQERNAELNALPDRLAADLEMLKAAHIAKLESERAELDHAHDIDSFLHKEKGV
tara:strand:+ start:797 stop:1177 length:381 start_codon:yes stop_codon:yes gene_type:complete